MRGRTDVRGRGEGPVGLGSLLVTSSVKWKMKNGKESEVLVLIYISIGSSSGLAEFHGLLSSDISLQIFDFTAQSVQNMHVAGSHLVTSTKCCLCWCCWRHTSAAAN